MARPFAPYVGNKEKLVPYIRQLIPPKNKELDDVFGGSGSVILGILAKRGRLDIYNDLDGNLTNLMLCVKLRLTALCKEIGFLPFHSRLAFEWYRDFAAHEDAALEYICSELALLEDRSCFTEEQAREVRPLFQERRRLFDVQRAAAFFLSLCGSYNGTIRSFGAKPLMLEQRILRMKAASKRLEDIVIENKDAFQFIPDRDREGVTLYCDPPYFETEKMYAASTIKKKKGRRSRGAMTREAKKYRHFHVKLWRIVSACRGDVIISYNNCKWIRELYRDFYISALFRPNSMARTKDAEFGEFIITNYDPSPYLAQQLDLFETKAEKWELRLIHVPKHPIKQH